MELAGPTEPTTTSLYYDPVLDVHHKLPVLTAGVTSFYAAPQRRDDAERLWRAAINSAGYDRNIATPMKANRGSGAALILAREWQDSETETRLAAAIEASYEPSWDASRGEFTWGMGLNEPHPRGQFNAFLAAAEASGPGRWTALSAAPLAGGPQVVDVDFPNVAFSRAEWRGNTLHLRMDTLAAIASSPTSFRIVGAPPGIPSIVGGHDVRASREGPDVVVTAAARPSDLSLSFADGHHEPIDDHESS